MSSEASERLASLSCGMTGELLAQCSAGQGRARAREAGSGAGAGAAQHRGRYSALPGTARWLRIAPCLWHQGAGHPWPRPRCSLGATGSPSKDRGRSQLSSENWGISCRLLLRDPGVGAGRACLASVVKVS